LDIIQKQENQEAVLNGVVGMGEFKTFYTERKLTFKKPKLFIQQQKIGSGYDEIPGSIVSVETAPNMNSKSIHNKLTTNSKEAFVTEKNINVSNNHMTIEIETIADDDNAMKIPPVIFVLGRFNILSF
jgi:hypothetical protein